MTENYALSYYIFYKLIIPMAILKFLQEIGFESNTSVFYLVHTYVILMVSQLHYSVGASGSTAHLRIKLTKMHSSLSRQHVYNIGFQNRGIVFLLQLCCTLGIEVIFDYCVSCNRQLEIPPIPYFVLLIS